MRPVLLSIVVAGTLAASASAQQAASSSIEGLWVASQRYGPDVRGTLRLLARNGVLSAEIAGYTVPVRSNGRALSFELPDGKGSFRGVKYGNEIRGQWIQQRTVNSGASFSTPVTLQADSAGR